MPTCCFCEPELIYRWETFLQDVGEFMIYTTPTAIAVVLWKVFVTNRRNARGDITVLRLDESSLTYSPEVDFGPSPAIIILYVLTSLATFSLGVLAFEAVHTLT
jgi:hypothetical protein